MEPTHRRAVVVVEEPGGLGEAGRQPFGVLEPPAIDPELVLLPRPQPRGVELRHLQPQQILAPGPIAVGRPRPLELGRRGAVLREQVAHAVAELFGIRESVQEVELPRRLEQALVLVLAVDLDQVVAEAFEHADRDRRIVHEGAVATGTSELSANHQLSLVETEPGLVERGRDRTPRRYLEHRFHGRRLGVGADDVGLGAGAADEEDRVEKHRLSGAGLSGEHVEAGLERYGDGVDHGKVANSNLEEHLGRC